MLQTNLFKCYLERKKERYYGGKRMTESGVGREREGEREWHRENGTEKEKDSKDDTTQRERER